jgi:threonine dehydratase
MSLWTRRFGSRAALSATTKSSALPAWVRPGAHDYVRDILESRVYDVAMQTPLAPAPALSKTLPRGCRLLLKREDLQPTFSFSLRGAHNKIANLTALQRQNGIVACAAGNHLQVPE